MRILTPGELASGTSIRRDYDDFRDVRAQLNGPITDERGIVIEVTAPFAAGLCGYRANGNPSTSDNGDAGSIGWGHALFQALGVAEDSPEIASVGNVMESAAATHLASLRPDLIVRQSRAALEFEQYRHLDVFRRFTRNYRGPKDVMDSVVQSLSSFSSASETEKIAARLIAAQIAATEDHDLVVQLIDTMPEESMLKIDITVGGLNPERLLVALSSKWSLRTDRAQDCVSQGSKLVSTRRGHMPHYAVLTMEPRPAMLKLIAYGSGSVDCVYHAALPELREAAATLEAERGQKSWPQRTLLERMVAQGRVRSYGQLTTEIGRLPVN